MSPHDTMNKIHEILAQADPDSECELLQLLCEAAEGWAMRLQELEADE